MNISFKNNKVVSIENSTNVSLNNIVSIKANSIFLDITYNSYYVTLCITNNAINKGLTTIKDQKGNKLQKGYKQFYKGLNNCIKISTK